MKWLSCCLYLFDFLYFNQIDLSFGQLSKRDYRLAYDQDMRERIIWVQGDQKNQNVSGIYKERKSIFISR